MTHYVYCVTSSRTGEFYIGIHGWNGVGVDPAYFSSSEYMQRLWIEDFDSWSVNIIDSEFTSNKRDAWASRRRLSTVETLLIAENVDSRRCINRRACLKYGDGPNKAFRLARDIRRHERGGQRFGPEPRPGTVAWHEWDLMRRLGERLKAAL
jgi:hypothetical protein